MNLQKTPLLTRFKRITNIMHQLALVVSLALAPIYYCFAIDDFDLPDYGDRSTLILPQAKQDLIGLKFLQQLYTNNDRISDPELLHYINTLGKKIGKHADLGSVPLTLNILEKNQINAFAVPGGYITFYSGLITQTANESELASVVAHEIAHITQKHLPRMLSNIENDKFPTMAAIIASILIGGDVGLAGVTLSNAQFISNQLQYSRGFEREADAVGIRLLSEAGFDPTGMPSFFGKLERQARIQQDMFLEFLQTHPLSFKRIAESNERVNRIGKQEHKDSIDYLFAKTKLQAIHSNLIEHSRLLFEKRLNDPISSQQTKLLSRYGLSYVYSELNQFEQAHVVLQPAIDNYPDIIALQIAKANIYYQQGNHNQAIKVLSVLSQQHPDLHYIRHYIVQNHLMAQQGVAAEKLTRFLIRRNDDEIVLYDYLRRANQLIGNYTEAAQADAEYWALLGAYPQSIQILKTALTRLESNQEYYRNSIEARISKLEELAQNAKKLE